MPVFWFCPTLPRPAYSPEIAQHSANLQHGKATVNRDSFIFTSCLSNMTYCLSIDLLSSLHPMQSQDRTWCRIPQIPLQLEVTTRSGRCKLRIPGSYTFLMQTLALFPSFLLPSWATDRMLEVQQSACDQNFCHSTHGE